MNNAPLELRYINNLEDESCKDLLGHVSGLDLCVVVVDPSAGLNLLAHVKGNGHLTMGQSDTNCSQSSLVINRHDAGLQVIRITILINIAITLYVIRRLNRNTRIT